MKSTPFKELAAVLEKLERTHSSTAMIDILARFLTALSAQEVKMTAYLLTGRVGPSFSAPEFGIAQVLAARAVADACGVSAAKIRKMLIKLGDLGAVAALLVSRRGARLSIARVFENLQRIAYVKGPCAQKDKIDALVGLLRQASSVEAKYIIRTVVGLHRIGVAEMTFLQGVAKGFAGRKEDKIVLEHAYNVLSDLGEVAYRVARKGVASLKRVKPLPGVRVRMMLSARVADLDEVPFHLKGDFFRRVQI